MNWFYHSFTIHRQCHMFLHHTCQSVFKPRQWLHVTTMITIFFASIICDYVINVQNGVHQAVGVLTWGSINRGMEAMEANFLVSFHFVSHPKRCGKLRGFGGKPGILWSMQHMRFWILRMWVCFIVFLDRRSRSAQSVWAHLCWFKAKSCLLQYFCPFRASTQKSAKVCMVPWLEENTSTSGYAYLTYIDCDEASFARLDQYLGPWQRAWQGQPMHWCWQWAIRRPCKIQQ